MLDDFALVAHAIVKGTAAFDAVAFILKVTNVKVGNSYASCCVIVKNMQRCIFAIPHESIFPEDVTMELERTAKDSDNSSRMLRTKLQEMALPLKTELSKVLMDASISTFSMTPIKRNYAFERSDVPPGERYVNKINYPFKFQHKSSDAVNKDPDKTFVYAEDDNERYRGCEPLWIACPSCFTTFECPATSSLLSYSGSEKLDSEAEKESENFWTKLHCPKCPNEDEKSRISPTIIANQVRRQVEKFISKYYMGLMTCDDELCQYTTRSLNLRVMGDSEKGAICPNYPRCNGHLVRQYTEVELYRQLSYFCHVLDTGRCLEKMEAGVRVRFEKQFARIRLVADLAAESIKRILDRCAYDWIKLEDLTLLSV